MGKHRTGIIFGLILIVVGGGAFGYFLGSQAPDVVTGTFHVAPGLAPLVAAGLIAGIGLLLWGIGELFTALTGAVERRAIVVRLGIALIGSLVSVVSSALQLFGVVMFTPNRSSIFSYVPVITGLSAVAIGAHALIHQIRLNRERPR